jgi:hypothetical protein
MRCKVQDNELKPDPQFFLGFFVLTSLLFVPSILLQSVSEAMTYYKEGIVSVPMILSYGNKGCPCIKSISKVPPSIRLMLTVISITCPSSTYYISI